MTRATGPAPIRGPLTITVALAGAAGLALAQYPGSTVPFVAFNAAFIGLLALALPRPRLYVYTFLALFLFLGFWGKLWVHFALGFPFVEPTGAFDGAGASWDRALWIGATGAAGFALARAVQLVFHRSHQVVELIGSDTRPVPQWFVEHRRAVWIATGAAVAGLNVWNVGAAFYQIGVNPRLVLPLGLNVPIAWFINVGFGLLVAVLVHWELRSRPRNAATALLAPVAEAIACSGSTLSRSAYVLHAGPYVLAAIERHRELSALVVRGRRAALAGALVLGFGVSLVLVQALRASLYFAPAPPPALNAAAPAQLQTPAPEVRAARESYFVQLMRQVPFLMVHRWVGLEGVLAVSAYSRTSIGLLREAMLENPNEGANSLYQRIARSFYADSDRFTFLTLPGTIGVLAYSGSLMVVLLGAALIAAAAIGTEVAAARGTGNPFLLAVAGAAMANVVSNLNFPYLAAIFLAQLWVALAAIRLLHLGPTAPRAEMRHTQ